MKSPSTDERIEKMYNTHPHTHIHRHTHIHTQEYYSALPFATTWMGLKGVILSEISQRKTNILYHLYVESKK